VWSAGYNFKIDDKTEAGVTAFYNNLHNAIWWANHGSYWQAANVYRQKKRGMTLSMTHHLNKLWDIDAAYTYVRVVGTQTDYTRDLNYAPNYFQAGVRYHDTKWNVSLRGRGGSGLAQGKYYGEHNYFTLDLAARYKFTNNWTGFANIYNLNNAAYAEYAGAVNGQDNYPMPGRRIIVGAEYTF
jgi:vitamin B12 transporter